MKPTSFPNLAAALRSSYFCNRSNLVKQLNNLMVLTQKKEAAAAAPPPAPPRQEVLLQEIRDLLAKK